MRKILPHLADIVAILVCGQLVYAGKLDASTASYLILAILAGKLHPFAPQGGTQTPSEPGNTTNNTQSKQGPQVPPGGLLTLCVAPFLLIAQAYQAMQSHKHTIEVSAPSISESGQTIDTARVTRASIH